MKQYLRIFREADAFCGGITQNHDWRMINDPSYKEGYNKCLNEAKTWQSEQPAPTPESQWPTEAIEELLMEIETAPDSVREWLQSYPAAIQWLQTSAGTREGEKSFSQEQIDYYENKLEKYWLSAQKSYELEKCLGELVEWYDRTSRLITQIPAITKAKSLLNPYKEKPPTAGDLYGGA